MLKQRQQHVYLWSIFSFYSQESNNLTNLSSFRYNGLVHKKAVGVVPATEKKGFTVVLKTKKNDVSEFIHLFQSQEIYELHFLLQNDVYFD